MKKNAFTLLELMIVVIIVGVLASLAIPRFTKATEKAKWVGPVQILGSLKRVCFIYYSEHGVYPGSFSQVYIDDPNPPPPYEKNQFRYVLNGGLAGSHYALGFTYKDISGNGGYNGGEPHIWIYDDNELSSQSGAPEF